MKNFRLIASIAILFFAAACAAGSGSHKMSSGGKGPKDGGLKFPAGYDTFPRFISGIQKPAHVRDLFINKTGAKTKKGESFPNGTVLVMEIYNAKKDGGGYVMKRPDGRNAKDNLAKVFIMKKGPGWGKNAPADAQTGDWIFSAFAADGTPIKANYTKCRQCHMPLKDKDFVHRYDEYFDKRGY